jgi:RNA polymerase sigma factor (sigma-70 family)
MSEKPLTSGPETRFDALVEEYGKFLRSVIAQTCPRNLGIQINDIEQESHLRLWRALQSERELTGAASYIYRIAVTTTIDAVRRVMARHEEQEDESEDETGRLAVGSDRWPDRVAQRSLLMQKVEGALMRLPENRRIAVEFYLQGMTSQEIADLCDWNEPKARNLIYRGLKDLRKRLRDEGVEYEQ